MVKLFLNVLCTYSSFEFAAKWKGPWLSLFIVHFTEVSAFFSTFSALLVNLKNYDGKKTINMTLISNLT